MQWVNAELFRCESELRCLQSAEIQPKEVGVSKGGLTDPLEWVKVVAFFRLIATYINESNYLWSPPAGYLKEFRELNKDETARTLKNIKVEIISERAIIVKYPLKRVTLTRTIELNAEKTIDTFITSPTSSQPIVMPDIKSLQDIFAEVLSEDATMARRIVQPFFFP